MWNHCHSHIVTNSSVHQSLDELEFERGIWSAALDGDKERVTALIQKGTLPDAVDSAGYTALHYAARMGHLKVAEALVIAGANVNAITRAGSASALLRAATAGHLDMVKFLLSKGANVLARDSDGLTALHRAVQEGRKDMVCYLISVAPQLETMLDAKGRTPQDCAPVCHYLSD